MVSVGGEPVRVEAGAARGADEVAAGQVPARCVQRVVHLPERPLCRGRLRRLGGAARVRVRAVEREVAEHEAQAVPEALLDPGEDALGGRAVRALEVPVHDELEVGARRAADVVARVDGLGEAVGHRRGS